MARNVKKGSYWRTLQGPDNIVEVIKLLEDGLSDRPVLAVRPSDLNQIHNLVILDHPQRQYYRCKKNGEWFGAGNEVSQLNRKFLSLRWQVSGALKNLIYATQQLKKLDMEEFAGYDWEAYGHSLLRDIETARVRAIRKLQAKAADTKEQEK